MAPLAGERNEDTCQGQEGLAIVIGRPGGDDIGEDIRKRSDIKFNGNPSASGGGQQSPDKYTKLQMLLNKGHKGERLRY